MTTGDGMPDGGFYRDAAGRVAGSFSRAAVVKLADPVKLSHADKTRPLRSRSYRGEQTTCALCGADIFNGEWCVTLPDRLGVAQPGCAGDQGWAIQ